MKNVVIDISEMLANPIRMGIQRVVRELIRHWPSPSHLRLARYDPSHGLKPLPDAILPLLLDNDARARDADHSILKRYLEECLANNKPQQFADDYVVLLPELFYDHSRCEWYRKRVGRDPCSIFVLMYDFIPWLYPERIGVAATASLMRYVRMVRGARCTAFISGQTRSDYIHRIRRSDLPEAGPVLPLGADGLGLEKQPFSPEKNAWVAIGAINGNKNQDIIFEAFRLMWEAGFTGELVMIGRVFAVESSKWLDEALTYPRFRHLVDVPDEIIRRELRRARATIYVSSVEGFGLPPVESLHAGIPAIVTESIPSIADLPHDGQIRVRDVTVAAIGDAVQVTADDVSAARLWQEAGALQLATWRDFAHRTAAWIEKSAADAAAPHDVMRVSSL